MRTGRTIDMGAAGAAPIGRRPVVRAAGWARLASGLFGGEPVPEAVATRVHFGADPEEVWRRILFYEEAPGRAPLLLRLLLPSPVRTEGGKTTVGSLVRCTYRRGGLVKRITAVEPASFVAFDVVEQYLGIEDCVLTCGGSYRLQPRAGGTDVELVTRYRTRLRPRGVWRAAEALLVGQLHGHILQGIDAALHPAGAATPGGIPPSAPSGSSACTRSPSSSRR